MKTINPVYNSRSYYFNNIFITEHTPTTDIRGLFILLHGFPAWVSKNYDIGEVLAQQGYKIYIPHHQGLGQSKGLFKFTENVNATRELINQIQNQNPNLGLSLMGHSWGGYLSLRHLDLISERLILLAPLARFPTDERRKTLVHNLFKNNKTDLEHYSLENLESEFELLEKNLNPNKILQDSHICPNTLLIYGTNDDVIPADLIKDFSKEVYTKKIDVLALNDDHRLSKRRPVLNKIAEWIN